MTEAFPQASVEDFEPLIAGLQVDPKDRHVLAATIRSDAHTIVTFNLKDFPRDGVEPWGISVVHPDDFLLDQLDLHPGTVMSALAAQARHNRRPPSTVAQVLGALSRTGLPRFADEARRYLTE